MIHKRETAAYQKKIESAIKHLVKPGNIKDFTSCPHCMSNYGYFQQTIVHGVQQDNTLFSGEKANEHMWDCISDIWCSKYYYCIECTKPICRVRA